MGKVNLQKYVKDKTEVLKASDKSFKSIYNLTFTDKDLVMFEYSVGSRINKLTYGEVEWGIESTAHVLKDKLSFASKGDIIGLYAQNSVTFVEVFWALLKCGFKPLLLNTRTDLIRLENVIKTYNVSAVISDGQDFSVSTVKFGDIVKQPFTDKVDDFADEIIVMSSGTTLNSKLCFYSGKDFYYQLLDSANIIKTCPEIIGNYKGEIKLLTFLPLYHIFGLAAMFMWFSFYQRTFVLLPSLEPDTITYTIRKHKVTHIFAVPLLWETVYKKFRFALAKKDAKTIRKFEKGYNLVKKTKSRFLAKKLFKPVRELIFGDSIRFLISGGSGIPHNVLEFFNVIGYRLSNGYGMSEVGITSVETSSRFVHLTDGSIGKPFTHVEYKLNDSGELLIKGNSVASKIYVNGKLEPRPDGYYNSKDVAVCINGRYFIKGRADDMIVGPDGENINPEYYETQINIKGAVRVCITTVDNIPSLVIEVNKYSTKKVLDSLQTSAMEEISRLGINGVIGKILFTSDSIIGNGEIKLNRKKVAKLKFKTDNDIALSQDVLLDEVGLKVKELFAKALSINEDDILPDAHFFFDLNGTSLDYFALISDISNEFGIQILKDQQADLYTINDFKKFLESVL
ncbi:MAG: AMP-binding protein [Clostridia bacterium]|nr:AMP-binding protein [Clostridia bacterium]